MIRRTPVFLFVLLISAMLLSACVVQAPAQPPADDASQAASPEAAAEPVSIAFVSHTRDITDLFGQLFIGFENTLQENGVNYQITAAAPRDSSDHEGMDRILSDLISAQPDYLVFGPTSFELNQPRLVDLENAGVKIIMTDYPPPADGFDINPLTWVIYDHTEMGRRSGYWAGQQFCEQGKDGFQVAMFWGPAASEISQARGGGVLQGLDEAAAECGITYEVVEEVFADFNRERAFNLAETVATAHPDLDLAVGMNSNTALGIMQSLKLQNRLEDVLVIGMGGVLDELAAICVGDVGVAPFRDPRDMGRLAAEALMLDMAGQTDQIPDVSYTAMPVIDSCEAVFANVPLPFLDQPGFRDLIPPEMWEAGLAQIEASGE
jgi:ABC-type sugar transport system substrate-binding protein